MDKTASKLDFEILVSTMHRESLDFLKSMFPNGAYQNYNILIINQTTQENLLESSHQNIRVINAFETGLSKSRNLAIKNAKGSICLFADDDVTYVIDFNEIVLSAYKTYRDADIITFKMVDFKGKMYRDYPEITIHDKKTVSYANSVVISFRRKALLDKEINFNTNFGLGSEFETGDEYVFLRDALKANLNVYFYPEVIVVHATFNSGIDVSADHILHARSALFYKYSGTWAYVRVLKHFWNMYLLGVVKLKEFPEKIGVSLKGIKTYKQLLKNGLERKR
jgi:glycosyltransferase involved in cell wall biosynthesis